MSDIQGVIYSQKPDGSWLATHEASGKLAHGYTKDEANQAMRAVLGMNNSGHFEEPITSDQFDGIAKDIAVYLEKDVSEKLAIHSGFARLESYESQIAFVKLGGGCSGCPSSTLTLVSGVKTDLQDKFGEETIIDVAPVI